MAAPTSSERTRTNWTPSMERYFIDLMLDQMHKGNRLGHTFNKQAWTDMQTVFNAKFGCKYDRDTLKSHYTILWMQYNDVKNLLDQNGFAWDDTLKMVTAPPHVWDAYIKSQPAAQLYRGKNLNTFNDLCLIYAYTQADGRYSRSSHDLDFDDDNQGVNFGSIPPASNEHPKIEWTPAMEQYFIELMLDQIKMGNKSNDTFNRQGWKDMLTSFNTKFCSQYGKSFLNRRLKKLSKYYTEVQCLLQQKGFSWDEKQQMIIADDGLWDKYIKVHPEARTYRMKRLLNYHDLLLIFGNASNNGLGGCMRHRRNIESRMLPANTGEEKKGCPFDRSDSLSIGWTPEMDRYLIDLLLDQALRGNKIGHLFIPEAWSEIETGFNERFGSQHDKGALKNRSRFFRRQHNDIKSLLDQNGFSWDDTQEMVTAEDYVWDYYVKVHPSAQSYRKKSVPNYHKLCVIYGEERSNGLCSYLDQTVDLACEGSDLMIGDDSQLLANEDSPSRDWTSLMDRHLIDLLLEQVHKGNRTKHTFNREAWMEMALSFMHRFGLQLDEDLLRNHHKSLGKLYNNMKILLDQGGFSWDETRQMITAHDVVWDTYIKEHPDAGSYRNKSKPNYYDLCLIYGNSTYDGKGNQSEQDAGCNGNGIKLSNGNGNGNGNGYCWRTDWTPPMDRYFIDLMLKQVYQGSMVHKKFNKHAWDDMISKFREEFGHQYNKDVLKSHFINLRRQFIDMKILLDQRGFAWDRMQCMIVADDFLWDAYVKEHPDARAYHNRSLPSYDDLFLIFGNANNEEHFDPENYPFKDDYESPASSSSPTEGLYGSENVNIEPDIGNDTLDNGFHDIFGDLQSLAAEFEISDLRKKRKPYDSSISVFPRKAQKPCQDIQEAFDENTSMYKTQFTYGEDRSYSSIENIVDALQDVPGMDDELFLEASKLLEDEKNAKKFLAMDVKQRRKWLRRKLCH